MDPTLQAGPQASPAVADLSQTGPASDAAGDAIQQMVAQGTQQIFGMILNLLMSQTGEG